MTLKPANFVMTQKKKYPQKSSYLKKIFIFLKIPPKIEIQNFEPQKMGRAYVCVKISEYPPGMSPCNDVTSRWINRRSQLFNQFCPVTVDS